MRPFGERCSGSEPDENISHWGARVRWLGRRRAGESSWLLFGYDTRCDAYLESSKQPQYAHLNPRRRS